MSNIPPTILDLKQLHSVPKQSNKPLKKDNKSAEEFKRPSTILTLEQIMKADGRQSAGTSTNDPLSRERISVGSDGTLPTSHPVHQSTSSSSSPRVHDSNFPSRRGSGHGFVPSSHVSIPVGQPRVPVGHASLPVGQPVVPVGEAPLPVGQPVVPVGQPVSRTGQQVVRMPQEQQVLPNRQGMGQLPVGQPVHFNVNIPSQAPVHVGPSQTHHSAVQPTNQSGRPYQLGVASQNSHGQNVVPAPALPTPDASTCTALVQKSDLDECRYWKKNCTMKSERLRLCEDALNEERRKNNMLNQERYQMEDYIKQLRHNHTYRQQYGYGSSHYVEQLDFHEIQGQLDAAVSLRDNLFKENIVLDQKIKDLNEQLEKGTTRGNCCICHDDLADTVVLNCRHMCLCSGCANMYKDTLKDCPLCRKPVTEFLQIYLS